MLEQVKIHYAIKQTKVLIVKRNIMKKVLLISCIFAAAVFTSLNVSLSLNKHSNLIGSLIYSIKSLSKENSSTESGSLPANCIAGKKMGQVLVKDSQSGGANVGVTVGSGYPSFSFGFNWGMTGKYYFCCVSANPDTACDKSGEDSACNNVNLS